jgi:hypothetical protein
MGTWEVESSEGRNNVGMGRDGGAWVQGKAAWLQEVVTGFPLGISSSLWSGGWWLS